MLCLVCHDSFLTSYERPIVEASGTSGEANARKPHEAAVSKAFQIAVVSNWQLRSVGMPQQTVLQ